MANAQDKHLSNGSIIYWSRRKGKQVPVLCGSCRQERLVEMNYAARKDFMGICRTCAAVENRQDETLPNGSIIYWSRRKDNQVIVQCGKCRRKRKVSTSNATQDVFTGICQSCARKDVATQNAIKQDEQLPTGSIIFWSRRNGNEIPVQCGKCKQERIVLNKVATQKTFTGFCYDCGYASQRKYTEDVTLPNGSVVYWSERQGGRDEPIRVKCGICGTIRTIPAQKVANPNFTGYCADCARTGSHSHHWKGGRFKHPNGYILIRLAPDHPFYSMADSHHLVPEHRLIMAQHIGRPLQAYEIVHHKNGRKDDNRIANLELLSRNLHHTGFQPDENSMRVNEVSLWAEILKLIKIVTRKS